DHRQQAVLQTVLPENIREAGRDDRIESEVFQSPHGMLTRAAAPEVIPGDQDLGSLLDRVIRAVFEQMRPDTNFVRHLQKTRRDDLICIDVFLRNNRDLRCDLHAAPPYRRGSATRPSTALAAAVSGDASSVRAPFP